LFFAHPEEKRNEKKAEFENPGNQLFLEFEETAVLAGLDPLDGFIEFFAGLDPDLRRGFGNFRLLVRACRAFWLFGTFLTIRIFSFIA
jgi:hypothetical protein